VFSSNSNAGFFVEVTEQAIRLARTSARKAPLVIEDVRECAPGDAAALAEAMRKLQPKKSASGFLHASVGIYPSGRLVRKHPIELKRLREANYINEIFTQQLRIEQDKYTTAMLHACDGTDYDLDKATKRDVLFCGLPTAEILTLQETLLQSGIFPERLELGSLATLGGLVDFLGFSRTDSTILLVEVCNDQAHLFLVSAGGVDSSRLSPLGLTSLFPTVQKELGLKDEEAARKLFYSGSFDFSHMAPALVKKLKVEIDSFIGFFEVQTGRSVGQVIVTQLPASLQCFAPALAEDLSLPVPAFDPLPWLAHREITIPPTLTEVLRDSKWLGLCSLMVNKYTPYAPLPQEAK
jgi:hypothetical protein